MTEHTYITIESVSCKLSERLETIYANIIENFPDELKEIRQWLLWKAVPDGERVKKVPINQTGRPVDVTNPDNWLSWQAAMTLFRDGKADGVGFAFSESDPYCGIDLDDVVEDGKVSPEIYQILEDFNSYSEVSVSGTGIHILIRGRKPGKGCTKAFDGWKGEIYDSGRYFTVSGNRILDTFGVVHDCQPQLEELYQTWFGGEPATYEEVAPLTLPPSDLPPVSLSDHEIIDRIRRSNDKLARFMKGDLSGYDNDRSRGDFGLIGAILWWTRKDASRVLPIFELCQAHRPKLWRPDYLLGRIETILTNWGDEDMYCGDILGDYPDFAQRFEVTFNAKHWISGREIQHRAGMNHIEVGLLMKKLGIKRVQKMKKGVREWGYRGVAIRRLGPQSKAWDEPVKGKPR